MFVFALVVWYIIGAVSFIYWWTQDSDFKLPELFIMFIVALQGPFALITGFLIHSKNNPFKNDMVLFKKRT